MNVKAGRKKGTNEAYARRYTVAQIETMKSDPDTKFTLNLKEAAPVPGVSTKRLREMAARGEVPGARKIGNQWRFSTRRLISWVEGDIA